MSVFGIEEIYEGVIKDVMDQMREIFLDEGVDIDVMKMLKEKKIFESGVLIAEQTQKTQQSVPKTHSLPIAFPPLPTQIQQVDHDYSSQHQKGQIDGNKLPLPSCRQIPGIPYVVKVNHQQNKEATHNEETQKSNVHKNRPKRRIQQLDGGGVGMTDSSSEEEEEQINKIPIKKELEENDQNGNEEEEPLNSNDDLHSEDNEEETVFDVENVVVCQFQKIFRQRPNKWKFEFKDGIMHINGKDHCFHKCTGEAHW